MDKLLLVGVGGGIGSVLRYVLSTAVQRWAGNGAFPYGTLAVNLIGCLVIGVLAHLAEVRSFFTPEIRAFVFVGLLGGFTTFSSFGNDTLNLWRSDATLGAFMNVAGHIILGLGAVWLGREGAALVWK